MVMVCRSLLGIDLAVFHPAVVAFEEKGNSLEHCSLVNKLVLAGFIGAIIQFNFIFGLHFKLVCVVEAHY